MQFLSCFDSFTNRGSCHPKPALLIAHLFVFPFHPAAPCTLSPADHVKELDDAHRERQAAVARAMQDKELAVAVARAELERVIADKDAAHAQLRTDKEVSEARAAADYEQLQACISFLKFIFLKTQLPCDGIFRIEICPEVSPWMTLRFIPFHSN